MKKSLKPCARNHFRKIPLSKCHHPKPQCKTRPLIQNSLTYLHWNSFLFTSKSNFLSIFSPQPQLPAHTLSDDEGDAAAPAPSSPACVTALRAITH